MNKGLRVGCLPASLVSLEFSVKLPYFVSQSNECTLEFVWKRNSASCILGDVARFAKSVNFTFLITVGNLSSAKMQFSLVKKLENNRLLFYIYICAKPFSLTKNERKLFLVPESSGPLLERLPLKVSKLDYKLVPRFWNFCTDFCSRGTRFPWKREFDFSTIKSKRDRKSVV